ncbi:NAD(P)-dependent alcohol dehydrogenase [Hoeflea sp.]|uniref:NAD(P)-dependent alcohol dehydrogenase n=1 Tax=Hoeflea sp. TaxID=1940281 RepID=UPI003A9108AA
MKAISYSRYGSPGVLEPVELPKPVPKSGDVLVRVHATSVTSGDYRARSLDMPPGFGLVGRLVFGVLGPRRKILGTEFAGVVESVGSKVTRFEPGDRVFAYPGANFGGYAHYTVMDENAAIARMPGNLDFDEAVAIPFGGATALDFLRNKGGIKAGDCVLVIGASGGVGSAAVQLAKSFGAHVTGTASAGKREMVEALGADTVLDYTSRNPASGENLYDIILDTSGTATYSGYGAALKPGGRLLLVSSSLWQMLAALFARKTGGRKAIPGYAPERAEDLRFLANLAESGQFRPYIDRRFPLDQAAQAHAWFKDPARKGNVVITVESG